MTGDELLKRRTLREQGLRICSICHETKPLLEFFHGTALYTRCVECDRLYQREWKRRRPQRNKEILEAELARLASLTKPDSDC